MIIELIDERLEKENNFDIINRLKEMKSNYLIVGDITKEEHTVLDEYLKTVYDKTAEMHQIKKWIADFNRISGFNITGGIIDFKPEDYKDKSAVELIDVAGEMLKQNKHNKLVQ